MNLPETNDSLDTWLRQQNAYIEDNGFAARVIQALPRRRRAWLRPTLLSGATAIGFVLAILWLPWKNLPALDSRALQSLDSQVLLPWTLVFLILGSLIWSATAALQWED